MSFESDIVFLSLLNDQKQMFCVVCEQRFIFFFPLPWSPMKSVQYIEQSVHIYTSVCI